MTELSHDRCSELLETYVSGTLDAAQRRSVDEHLASCADCSLELVAVHALTEPVVSMSGAERDELSRAVRAAIVAPQKRSLSERFGRRMAPALGAVAFLAIAVIALVSLPDDSPSPTAVGGRDSGTTMDSETEQMQPVQEQGAAQKDSAGTLSDTASGTTTGAGSAGGGDAAGDSAPNSETATSLEASASRVDRSNFMMEPTSFAATGISLPALVPPRRGIDAYDYDARAIALSAPNNRVAELIRECSERTIATSPHPLTPSSAIYYADDVLVIGFVWVDPSTSRLNFEVRGWTDGSCDQVSPIYRRGALE
jgi:hypothetical protein